MNFDNPESAIQYGCPFNQPWVEAVHYSGHLRWSHTRQPIWKKKHGRPQTYLLFVFLKWQFSGHKMSQILMWSTVTIVEKQIKERKMRKGQKKYGWYPGWEDGIAVLKDTYVKKKKNQHLVADASQSALSHWVQWVLSQSRPNMKFRTGQVPTQWRAVK